MEGLFHVLRVGGTLDTAILLCLLLCSDDILDASLYDNLSRKVSSYFTASAGTNKEAVTLSSDVL